MPDRESEERVTLTPEQLAISNMLSQEALARVLIRKGIITEKEVLDEIEVVNREWAASQKSEERSAYDQHFNTADLEKQP